ncbi:Xaa-Pro peptidase family protein [Sphingobium sp. H39-3-25]|uniref:M24 family metallopeptidase n=1 Tax=Sphingobium arseniciresistens TaxID=3030834 RepID=UPI0023B99CEF|nr:Xaa-Pro peptidase family protein [Sphingobium arseniciresistens]
MTHLDRRTLLTGLGIVGGAGLLGGSPRLFAQQPGNGRTLDQRALEELAPLPGTVAPIGVDERKARLARAQALMQAADIGAILVEPGASLIYFTGVQWWRSERLTAAVIPAQGDPIIVTPFFEQPSVALSLGIPAEVRVWQEDESPFALIATFLKEKGLARARIGIEETARFFAFDGVRALLPDVRLVSADPVVRGCRMRKTASEIALMQRAADVTMAAYRWSVPQVRVGMAREEIGALMNAATRRLGGQTEFNLILVGPDAALPHGSPRPQVVGKGSIVLMDCGCTVEGYQSDISRTFVVGADPTAEQRKVWNEVAKGQQVALAAAKPGAPAGSVDDAVRAYYQSLGYGPGYRLPGLSHRTGHGIGMEGHEPVNLVHGETTPLAPGMCFSNEPGLYLPGRFGVRLEDCFHMTQAGPRWFSTPPESIDAPVG